MCTAIRTGEKGGKGVIFCFPEKLGKGGNPLFYFFPFSLFPFSLLFPFPPQEIFQLLSLSSLAGNQGSGTNPIFHATPLSFFSELLTHRLGHKPPRTFPASSQNTSSLPKTLRALREDEPARLGAGWGPPDTAGLPACPLLWGATALPHVRAGKKNQGEGLFLLMFYICLSALSAAGFLGRGNFF